MTLPLSVLDLAVVGASETSADAFGNTTRLAKAAEALGYARFWVAEHHNSPLVASTVPAVLLAHLGAQTSRIHLGSGGVMLNNHTPLQIAEQFAMLEALYPGRINLGLGRAPGTDSGTATALSGKNPALAVEDYPRSVVDLLGLLGDPRAETGVWDHMIATPMPTTAPAVILLGSSDYSARLAGSLGLPFAFANHFDTGGTLAALDTYRASFQPSDALDALDAPYAIVTANVLVADSDDEAEHLAGPGRLMLYGIRTGRFYPLLPPDEAAAHPAMPHARLMRSNRIVGARATVRAALDALVAATRADELMVACTAHSIDERMQTLASLAEIWREV
jgi:luciferase family oxidoreductase group 1